jgi:protein O-GlcNAc transferase
MAVSAAAAPARMLSLITMRGVFSFVLALCLQAPGQSSKVAAGTDAKKLSRLGAAARQHGDFQSAIDNFRKALAIDPKLMEAHLGLGEALAATGQLDAAIEEDLLVVDADPGDAVAQKDLGSAYYQKGDLVHARQQFEALHEAEPKDVTAAVLLSSVYVKMGRASQVVEMLRPLEAGHENNMELEYVLGFSLIQTGSDKEGVSRMERVAKATNSASAYLIAGSALLNRGQASNARADLIAAMKLDPHTPGLSTLLGQAEYALGDMAAATTSFEEALRADPRDFNANLDLGAILLKESRRDEARPLLELALELQPTVPLARMEMAKLDELSSRYAEAAAILEELVKAEPNWMDAHWELASAYYELNRPEDGKRERTIAQDLRAKRTPQPLDPKE